jgi:cytochrome c oxidase subunit 3
MADHAVTMEAEHESHFESLERQQVAARFGMWVFLSSELMLFAGLLALYVLYRGEWPEAFAEAVNHNPVWIGTTNTAVLITASLTVALGLHELQHDRPRAAYRYVGLTVLLALVFLALKGYEYSIHVNEGILPGGVGRYFREGGRPGQPVFFTLYWVTTGLHAMHVIVGMTILMVLGWRIRRGTLTAAAPHPLEVGALYWHLVDSIWIFLWPMYYLTGAHHP